MKEAMRLRENGMEKFCQTWEIILPLENEGDEDRFLSEWKVNYFFQPLIKRAKVTLHALIMSTAHLSIFKRTGRHATLLSLLAIKSELLS